MRERQYVVVGFLMGLSGIFVSVYLFNGAGTRAVVPATLTTLVSFGGMMMMYFFGRSVGESTGAPTQTYPTAENIAATVARMLTESQMAYDPEHVGQRLTAIQATLAEIVMAVHRLEVELQRRSM